MQGITMKRAGLAAGAAAIVPLISACGGEMSVLDRHAQAVAIGYQYPVVAAGTARSAFIVVDDAGGGAKKAVAYGAAAADITQTATTADYTIKSDKVHDMVGLQKTQHAWIDPANNNNLALVIAVPDADKDGTPDDTFLIYSQNRPVSPDRAEYSYAYYGTRTPSHVMVNMTTADHKATYRGTAALSGTIGTTSISQSGDLELTASFGAIGTGILGNITNLSAVAGNPAKYDRVKLLGDLTADRTDYAIQSVELYDGDKYILQNANSQGIGSFFGANGGGTIGVFSHQSKLIGTDTEVNLIGYLHGTTTDNN